MKGLISRETVVTCCGELKLESIYRRKNITTKVDYSRASSFSLRFVVYQADSGQILPIQCTSTCQGQWQAWSYKIKKKDILVLVSWFLELRAIQFILQFLSVCMIRGLSFYFIVKQCVRFVDTALNSFNRCKSTEVTAVSNYIVIESKLEVLVLPQHLIVWRCCCTF